MMILSFVQQTEIYLFYNLEPLVCFWRKGAARLFQMGLILVIEKDFFLKRDFDTFFCALPFGMEYLTVKSVTKDSKS